VVLERTRVASCRERSSRRGAEIAPVTAAAVEGPSAAARPHVDDVATITYWAYRKGRVGVDACTASDVRLARGATGDARQPVHVSGR